MEVKPIDGVSYEEEYVLEAISDILSDVTKIIRERVGRLDYDFDDYETPKYTHKKQTKECKNNVRGVLRAGSLPIGRCDRCGLVLMNPLIAWASEDWTRMSARSS